MPSSTPFHPRAATLHPFGHLAEVPLPPGLEPVPAAALAGLPRAEADFASTLRGRRAIEWVGGRLALRQAAAAAGLVLPPVLPGARGEPLLPAGVQASISHKRTVALALVATGSATVGLDVEELAPARPAIAGRILREEELAALQGLDEAAQWEGVLARFASKEAIYKALHPHVRRYVAFGEASVVPGPPAAATLHLAGGEGPFGVELVLERREGLLLAAARIEPVDPSVHYQ